MARAKGLLARGGLAAASALITLGLSGSAWGFCRTTTCLKASCNIDAQACVSEGFPVFWASSCITISIQGDGAPHAGIDYSAAKASVERAVEAWTSVDCPGGGHPSIQVKVEGPVTCSEWEYSTDKHNANVVMFRDDVWPYEGRSPDALGFTHISFDRDSGELYDADIELNAVADALSVDRKPSSTEADLDSIITHEVGHLLGLDHTRDAEATMLGGYTKGTFELRTPAADDIAGICEIYPPDRQATSSSCEPRHGFSQLCAAEQPAETTPMPGPDDGSVDNNDTSSSCAFSAAASPSGSASGVGALAFALLLGLRRRRP